MVIGLWLVAHRRSPPPPTTPVSTQAPEPVLDPPIVPGLAPPEVEATPDASDLPSTCEDLALRARDGGPDAVLLAWLCPQSPLDAVAARAALLAVRTPDEAARLAERLGDHPELLGLALLVAQESVPATDTVPDPADAVVSPIDRRVLAQVQRAHTVIATPGLAQGERTRARAFVAKVHLQATQQLGIDVGRPPEPFARLLVGRALHYGRLFCLSYWRMRISGLSGLFSEMETRLLSLVLSLETNGYYGDAPRLMVELQQTREYLMRDGPRARIERRLADRAGSPWSLSRLLPLPNAIDRLLDQGFVDLAIAQALALSRAPGGPSLPAVEQMLRDGLDRAERGEYLALLEHRMTRARARAPTTPTERSGVVGHAAEVPWPRATAVADDAAAWIDRAPSTDGLPRRYALGRALLRLRPRPDAVAVLIDRGTGEGATPALTAAAPWLAEELAARDDGRRSWLQRRVAAQFDDPRPAESPAMRNEQEAARRRRFARVMRDDDRMPRGAGL